MESYLAIVDTIEEVAQSVRTFRLLFVGDGIPYEPGGHVDVEVLLSGGPQIRSYSMVAFGREGGLVIAVKLANCGRGGSAYMWSLQPGARVRVWRARNTLPVTFSDDRYVLIAGGIGITPITSVARALRSAGKSVSLHYCVPDRRAAPFLAELHALLGTDLVVHDSATNERLDVDYLIATADASSVHYVCGPLRLIEEVRQVWHRRDLPHQKLRFETFGSSGQLPTSSFRVHVRETGASLLVQEAESMLDVLVAAGQDIMYECRRGECGLCKVEVENVEGTIDHRDVFLSSDERTANTAMCCCVSRVYGNSVIVRLDGITHGRAAYASAQRDRQQGAR